MIFKSLHGKLSLILFGLLLLLGALSVPLILFATQSYRQEVDETLNRNLAGSLAAHLESEDLASQDPRLLGKTRLEIKRLMVINPNIDVYILDAAGNVLAYSGKPEAVKRSQVSTAPLRRFLNRDAPSPILGDDPRSVGGEKVFSVAPFPPQKLGIAEPLPGYVYVILDGQQYETVADLLARSYILRTSLWVTAAILVLVSLTGVFLFRLLTRRLRHLTRVMETGQIAIPWPGISPPQDEIDRLGVVYFQMSERLRRQVAELAQANQSRREMVSNVSHDLRTPLAALQGYLETLLMKEGELSTEEQREYLQVAVRHTERLSTLIMELFELSSYDSHEVQIQAETFSLAELVQDIVQQHALTAQKNDVRLEARFEENLPFVFADIGLIERVLENLIENSLRYTPAGGAITVSLTPQTDTIRVLVSDTGIGIGQEDIPHIFERFYRVPDQPGNLGSAGLGLAITKRILELHNTIIQVRSVPGQETAFTFDLPIHHPSPQTD